MSAITGIVSLMLSISISWPDDTRRYPITAFVIAAIVFMVCASTAVFAAIRDTYERDGESGGREPQ